MSTAQRGRTQSAEKILQAALELFTAKGYHETSVSDVIRKSGLSRPTFYSYFKDKKAVVDSLMSELSEGLSRLVLTMEVESWSSKADVARDLKSVIMAILETVGEHKEIVRVMMLTSFGRDNDFDRRVERYFNLLHEMIRRIIRNGMRSHNWPDMDADLYSLLIFGGIREFIFHWLVKGKFGGDLENEVDQIISLFLNMGDLESDGRFNPN